MARVIRMLNSIATGMGSWACNQEYLEGVQISSERVDEFLEKRLAVQVREEELPEIPESETVANQELEKAEEPKEEAPKNSGVEGTGGSEKTEPLEPAGDPATALKSAEDLRAEKEAEIDALDYNAQRGLAKTWGLSFTGNPSRSVLRAALIEEAIRRASQAD